MNRNASTAISANASRPSLRRVSRRTARRIMRDSFFIFPFKSPSHSPSKIAASYQKANTKSIKGRIPPKRAKKSRQAKQEIRGGGGVGQDRRSKKATPPTTTPNFSQNTHVVPQIPPAVSQTCQADSPNSGLRILTLLALMVFT